MEEFLMRIGDRWQAASSKEWIESENPYTGKPWARVPRGTAQGRQGRGHRMRDRRTPRIGRSLRRGPVRGADDLHRRQELDADRPRGGVRPGPDGDVPFDTDEEVVEIANDTPCELVAALWTTSIERAVKLPKRLQAGTVWVNAYRVVSYLAPFGGVKGSGVGRENGIEAIKEYLEAKSVFINGDPDVPNPFVMG